MKKIVCFVIITVAIVTSLSGCLFYKNWSGKRPCDQPFTKWISEDKTISFETNDVGSGRGKMIVNDETIEFYMTNGMSTELCFFSLEVLETNVETPENEYERWSCSYKSKKKFVATVKKQHIST